MKQSIIYKTLLILGIVIIAIFLSAGYLFFQNNKALIDQIREYNLNQTMLALDSREKLQLQENKKQLQQTVDMIAKNSSIFLWNVNADGLKQSLQYDLKQENIKAVKIFDTTVNELFLFALKTGDKIIFENSVQQNLDQYKTIQSPIIHNEEKIGKITLYYDDSLIKEQIKTLKQNTKDQISSFDNTIDEKLISSNYMKLTIAFIALLAILLLTTVLLIKLVNKPLNVLKDGLDDFFLFLQNKKDNTQKIYIHSNDEFGQMAKSLNENIQVSAKLHEEIHELNTNLEKKVEDKTQKVTMLLDNAGQGFLTFNDDFLINPEYSKECEKLLGNNIAHKDISSLLFKDLNKIQLFKTSLLNALDETMDIKRNSYLSLLPSVILLNKRAVKLEYKIIDEKTFMLILTNITSEKKLEKKIKKEQEILKMIVAVVSESDVFYEVKNEYIQFYSSFDTLIDKSKTPLYNITFLYRTIHTFKGTFSQLYIKQIVDFLHEVESKIASMQKTINYTNDDIIELLESYPFEKTFEKCIETIQDILGEEFVESDNYLRIDLKDITTLQQKIEKILQNFQHTTPECKDILTSVQKLSNTRLYSQLQPYISHCKQLALRLEKDIYEFSIIGDKNLVVSNQLKPFLKSLIHVFRNCIDHGIESPEERLEKDKDEIGTISCSYDLFDNANLHITISDDGAGIDIDKIKQKLKEQNIDTQNYSVEQLYSFIFEDNFSTKENLTDLSGRGVGMSAVKYELDQLNGNVNITSQKGIGTTLEFVIPYK